MRKAAVFGNAGGGRSTLARWLAELTVVVRYTPAAGIKSFVAALYACPEFLVFLGGTFDTMKNRYECDTEPPLRLNGNERQARTGDG
jgi:hypothetical protein